jgi:hypothetical protein
MRGAGVHQRAEHHLPPAGAAPFPVVQKRLDLHPLQPVLRPAQVAGDDRIAHRAGESVAIGLRHEGQRAQDQKIALLVSQLRRHRRQPPAVKEVHEEGLEQVVAMVPQHDRRTPFLARDAIEVPAPQPRAERAIGPPLRHLVRDDRIGVLVFDPVRDAHPAQELGQDGCRKTRLALVEVAGQSSTGRSPRHCNSCRTASSV